MPAGAGPGGTETFGLAGKSDPGERANRSRRNAESHCDDRPERVLIKSESMRVSFLPGGVDSTESWAETRSSNQGSSLESRAHPSLFLQAIGSKVTLDVLQICFVGHPVVVEVIPARLTVVDGEKIPIRNILGVDPFILISITGT